MSDRASSEDVETRPGERAKGMETCDHAARRGDSCFRLFGPPEALLKPSRCGQRSVSRFLANLFC